MRACLLAIIKLTEVIIARSVAGSNTLSVVRSLSRQLPARMHRDALSYNSARRSSEGWNLVK